MEKLINSRQTGMLLSLQYARAVAALLVVLAHLSNFEVVHRIGIPDVGGIGVDIFFVISGFIIAETTRNQTVVDFASRRLARIVPAYWFYTLLLACLAEARPSLAPHIQVTAKSLISSLLFIPYYDRQGNLNPILLQGWSLNYEMFFYLVFAIALLLKHRARQMLFVASLIIFLIALGGLHSFSQAAARVYTDPMMLEFLLGIGLNRIYAVRQYPPWLHYFSLILGASGLVIAQVSWQGAIHRAFTDGPSATVFLFGLIGSEHLFRRKPFATFRFIGDASYSLYLSHSFILSLLALTFQPLRNSQNPYVLYWGAILFVMLALVVSSVVACMSYAILEKPIGARLISYIKSKTNGSK